MLTAMVGIPVKMIANLVPNSSIHGAWRRLTSRTLVLLSKTRYRELNEFDAITLASANGYFVSVTKLISSSQ